MSVIKHNLAGRTSGQRRTIANKIIGAGTAKGRNVYMATLVPRRIGATLDLSRGQTISDIMKVRAGTKVTIFGGTQKLIGIARTIILGDIIAKTLVELDKISMTKSGDRLVLQGVKRNPMGRRNMPILVTYVPRKGKVVIGISKSDKTGLETKTLHGLLLARRIIHKLHAALLTTKKTVATGNKSNLARRENTPQRFDARHKLKNVKIKLTLNNKPRQKRNSQPKHPGNKTRPPRLLKLRKGSVKRIDRLNKRSVQNALNDGKAVQAKAVDTSLKSRKILRSKGIRIAKGQLLIKSRTLITTIGKAITRVKLVNPHGITGKRKIIKVTRKRTIVQILKRQIARNGIRRSDNSLTRRSAKIESVDHDLESK